MPNRLLLAAARRPAVKGLVLRFPSTRSIVGRFVAGESVEEGIAAARRLSGQGIEAILDYLGENIVAEKQADQAAELYLRTLEQIARQSPRTHISVKLTQLGLDLSLNDCLERMEKVCAKAAEVNTTVAIDMESHEYTDRTIRIYQQLRSTHSNLVLCLQACLQRTRADVASLLPVEPAIRLCKGAYDEPKDLTLDRQETKEAFAQILRDLLSSCPYTAVATHDDEVIMRTLQLSREVGAPPDLYEFQMLYGVRRDLQRLLARLGFKVRVYVPFGEQWYPYLMRRMAERPANLRLFLEALVRG